MKLFEQWMKCACARYPYEKQDQLETKILSNGEKLVDACNNLVFTIEEFQGREADSVVLSLVRSRPTVPASKDDLLVKKFRDRDIDDGSGNAMERMRANTTEAERHEVYAEYVRRNIGFVADKRRINEAITRARCTLFVFCNRDLLQLHSIWGEFFQSCCVGYRY